MLGEESGVALVAVGGYGRRELCPGSDLDLLLVHDRRRDVASVAERVWYPIWDSGIELDHSVRTVKEAVRVARGDLKTALGLLDGRVVAGDAALGTKVLGETAAFWQRDGRRWASELCAAIEERHRVAGEVAFLLEPDLKAGRGGLRDVVALRALQRTGAPIADVEELQGAYDTILAARVELHRRTGRRNDVLLLQEQDTVADALGCTDADALVGAISEAARTIAFASDAAVRRAAAWSARRVHPPPRLLGPGLELRDGEVHLTADADRNDPSLALRVAAGAARARVAVAAESLRELATVALPGDPWPPTARDALVDLLGAGTAAVPVLEALDLAGILVALVPEWASVRSRPQRNAYHRFTVDRHLCEAAANAAALSSQVTRPDLLLVGTWLHDIGKGVPGDHTEAGVAMVGRLGARFGFSPPDVEVLVAMVRHHLLLADVATRRDLDDPATVEAVAEAVGSSELLELLAALTEADSLATGPSAWGSWKAGLVADLVDRTARRLAGSRAARAPGFPTEQHRALMAAGGVAVAVDGNTLTVVAPDRPGMLARVAGVLALHGLDVRDASVAGERDMGVEVFTIDPPSGRAPDWDRVGADVELALRGRLALEARLAERARTYASAQLPRAARPARTRVTFDNDASESATVVEVHAPDAIGVLYRIARALAECELDVRTAKVSTLGHEVVDAFYVRDRDQGKVTDPAELAEIERAVLSEVRRAPGGPA